MSGTSLIARRYEILRAVTAGVRPGHGIALAQCPVRVATHIDEPALIASGGVLRHNDTVFLEDRNHDWLWRNGEFWYYSRVAQQADVVVVYELDKH